MYLPHEFTHQGIPMDGKSSIKLTSDILVRYPGNIAGTFVDKAALRRLLSPVREFQLANNARIFVGEFSAIRWAPGAARYLDDCISIFEEYGWDWAYHAFREWPAWSVEHRNEPADLQTHIPAQSPTDRALVLRKWFAKNQRPHSVAASHSLTNIASQCSHH